MAAFRVYHISRFYAGDRSVFKPLVIGNRLPIKVFALEWPPLYLFFPCSHSLGGRHPDSFYRVIRKTLRSAA